MKRSEINQALKNSKIFFEKNGWILPPDPHWDVTDFGLGNFEKYGLVLINLADEPEYCEKLMYAYKGQTTPAHTHKKKKEDIICRNGILMVKLFNGFPGNETSSCFNVKINGKIKSIKSGEAIQLNSGERVTIVPGIYHEFYPVSEECIIGEISTANNDSEDNFFVNQDIGRYPSITEDEKPLFKLINDQ